MEIWSSSLQKYVVLYYEVFFSTVLTTIWKKLNKENLNISKLGRSIRIGNELFIEIFAYFSCFINRNLQWLKGLFKFKMKLLWSYRVLVKPLLVTIAIHFYSNLFKTLVIGLNFVVGLEKIYKKAFCKTWKIWLLCLTFSIN